jgi:phage terminase small subunit
MEKKQKKKKNGSRKIVGNDNGLVSIGEMVRLLRDSKHFSKLGSRRMKRFVAVYCTNSLNGKQAALAAGYSARSAESYAGKMLADPKVRDAIKEFLKIMLDRIKEMISFQIIEIQRIRATYQAGDIIDGRGRLIVSDLKELGPLQYCIEGIETKYVRFGDEIKEQIIVKLADRNKALDMLTRYVDLINESSDTIINAGVLVVKQQKTKEEWKAMTENKTTAKKE